MWFFYQVVSDDIFEDLKTKGVVACIKDKAISDWGAEVQYALGTFCHVKFEALYSFCHIRTACGNYCINKYLHYFFAAQRQTWELVGESAEELDRQRW